MQRNKQKKLSILWMVEDICTIFSAKSFEFSVFVNMRTAFKRDPLLLFGDFVNPPVSF